MSRSEFGRVCRHKVKFFKSLESVSRTLRDHKNSIQARNHVGFIASSMVHCITSKSLMMLGFEPDIIWGPYKRASTCFILGQLVAG